jgi:hypothetical protein
MTNESIRSLSLFHALDGLTEGLSHYCGPSRSAIVYAVGPKDDVRIYDPQNLLEGHEPKLKEVYLDSDDWRRKAPDLEDMKQFGEIYPAEKLDLSGIVSFGGRSHSIFYQMWFTEEHPDMCAVGPVERWLEHAVWLLSHDFATEDTFYTGSSRYVLREYAIHAVREHILDQLNLLFGWDTQFRIYPILDAVLDISKTPEEGAWPRGRLVFAEAAGLEKLEYLVRFPSLERPSLQKFKHVRKMLQAVENSSDRVLVSDGKTIAGIVRGDLPRRRITAEFQGRVGFLRLAGKPVCSFSDGNFHASNRKPNLVQLEEALLESPVDPSIGHLLYRAVHRIVEQAAKRKHGCTLVLDFNPEPIPISGQQVEPALDLRQEGFLDLAMSLSKIDGALHIGPDAHLHGFACLLDGRTVPGEDRARGARFNSALRFTAGHDNVIVVVVSADRPVSIIQGGMELTATCDWMPYSEFVTPPPTLKEWIRKT